MRKITFLIGILCSQQGLALADTRVYGCIAELHEGIHLQSYWGENSSTLPQAQASALAACAQQSASPDFCLLNECWSTMPDGSDIKSEPINNVLVPTF